MRTHTLHLKISAVLAICVVALGSRSAAGSEQLDSGRAMMLRAIPEAVGMSSERLQMATAVLRQFVADHKIAGAVAGVARRGKIVYLEPVGLQDRETRTPMTERSLFRIYSMTKAVTAVGVMMLVEEGRIHLSDPASKFLPEFKNMIVQEITVASSPRKPSREITIQDLLLHTSGLSHRTSDLYQNLKVRSRSIGLPQFITNITNAPLMEDPGTRFRYSEATTVLGRIIEVVSKQPFDTFVINRILKPLEMNDTMFWADANAKSRLTTLYQGNDEGTLTAFENEDVPFTRKPALLEGAVGLLSTAEDFLKFSQMLLNNGELNGTRLLRTETVAAMTVNALPDSVLATKGGALGWGLANVDVVVGRTSRGYLTSIGEYGWDGSIGTFFAVDPSKELVVILMTQNVPANPDSLRQKFKAAVVQSIVQ